MGKTGTAPLQAAVASEAADGRVHMEVDCEEALPQVEAASLPGQCLQSDGYAE